MMYGLTKMVAPVDAPFKFEVRESERVLHLQPTNQVVGKILIASQDLD